MNPPLSPIFVDVLRACREEVNARFALMRREFSDLSADAYFEFLTTCGNPLVETIVAKHPDAAVETGRAIWEAGLELVARNFAGPKARYHWIDEMWQQVLPSAVDAIATDPHRVIGSLSNAMHQLASTGEARPQQWLELMQACARTAVDADSLLKAGQVAAWRSGLAHYREGALTSGQDLEPSLTCAALGIDGMPDDELMEHLRSDPWYDAQPSSETPDLLRSAGGFRGFGGPFLEPPTIALVDGQWIADSGEEQWIITADAFGATFHRLSDHHQPGPEKTAPESENLDLPRGFGVVTSSASDGSTTAVTTSLSHAVLFFRTSK